jgi:hypothetical protein
MEVLTEVACDTDETVTLDRPTRVQGVVKWPAGTTARSLTAELILPGKQHDLPTPPPLTSVPAKLLAALHEAGRTAARENGRYALSRVQIRGTRGHVIGTDGKVALVWSGVTFPFPDDLLVPAVPVFGCKPLARLEDVKIGRTVTHLVVAVGPWAVWLPADATARYPDIAGVIPRHAPTTAVIDEEDAAALLAALPGLPGSDHAHRPVTLDAGGGVRVRAHAEGDRTAGAVREVPLGRSVCGSPAIRVALDRRVLARALALGCRTWKLTPDKPVVAEGGAVTLVAAPLDPALATAPAGHALAHPPPDPDTPNPDTERRPTVKPETNGHPSRDEPPDPLELAEELRAALADAATKAARLVAALRHTRKEKKALASVLTSLKQLNLATDGGAR